jgi:hypothetical protein
MHYKLQKCLSVCLSVRSSVRSSVRTSLCQFVSLSAWLSDCLTVWLSDCLNVCLYAWLSVLLSVYACLCVCVCLWQTWVDVRLQESTWAKTKLVNVCLFNKQTGSNLIKLFFSLSGLSRETRFIWLFSFIFSDCIVLQSYYGSQKNLLRPYFRNVSLPKWNHLSCAPL